MGVIGSSDMMPFAEVLPLGSKGCASGRGTAEESNKPPGIKMQIIVIQRQRRASRATPLVSAQGQVRQRILRGMPGNFWSTQSCLLRIVPPSRITMGIDCCL